MLGLPWLTQYGSLTWRYCLQMVTTALNVQYMLPDLMPLPSALSFCCRW